MARQVRAIVVVIAMALAFGASGPADAVPKRKPAVAGNALTLTLITGDRVVLESRPGTEHITAVHAGKGRSAVTFAKRKERNGIYVIPSDALPLIAAGRVDRSLFNVSQLREAGYDDRALDSVPIIVSNVEGTNLKEGKALPSMRGVARSVAKTDATAFWNSARHEMVTARAAGQTRIWLDGPVRATLDQSAAQIGAPAAWEAGYTGQGAVVAVLDTGIDTTHPDLAGAVIDARDFSQSPSGIADRHGHGTHVAGIITGDGSASAGKYRGVAPDAKLLNAKVLNDYGFGRTSGVIAGMEWAVASGADVVSMSLGGRSGDAGSPLDDAVNRLTRETGVLFVIAAGNQGPYSKTVSSPGTAAEALTVGAVDRSDVVADFSGRGPNPDDFSVKPDIAGPGVGIVSVLAGGSLISKREPAVDGQYVRLSGTSMATPHVAGAAAIIAAQHPGWTASQLKPALMGAASPRTGENVYGQGAGRVDVARAVRQQVLAEPASLSNGMVRWPHEDDTPIRREFGYYNDGTEPIVLDLQVSVRDEAGQPAPAAMFTLDRTQITVPAKGRATATLTTDTRVPGPDGMYGGYIIATSGQTAVRTIVGVTREVESYDVNINALDAHGIAPGHFGFRLVNLVVLSQIHPSSPTMARVPAGRYYMEAEISTDTGGDRLEIAIMVEPELVVSGPMTITLDAREAKQVGFNVEHPEATSDHSWLEFARETTFGGTGTEWILGSLDEVRVRPSVTSAANPEAFRFGVATHMARPDGSGRYAGSPYLYHLRRTVPGKVPSDLIQQRMDRDLVTVSTQFANAGPDETVTKDFMVTLTSPAALKEFYSLGTTWVGSVATNIDWEAHSYDAVTYAEPVTYQMDAPLWDKWNAGVFGPAFPANAPYSPLAGRDGNNMWFELPLFTDARLTHQGYAAYDSVQLSLSRDGQVIGTSDGPWGYFDVPADPGIYRLSVNATRPSILSSQVSATWTFQSGTAATETALPLMAVRYAPMLDNLNRARAGMPLVFPVTVQHQVAGIPVHDLRMQVSYDEGATWRPVVLFGLGGSRFALVIHPAGATTVSLKANATDNAGNTVEQIIIRAYGLTP